MSGQALPKSGAMLLTALVQVDRRLIYLFVFLALAVPMVLGYTVTPARMDAAERFYSVVEELEPEPGDIAFVALDFGPNTKAENEPQAEVVIEHLLRRRIPFALFSLLAESAPFLRSIPERVVARLEREYPGERWVYGTDWVNLGYRPGAGLIIQAIPKSDDLVGLFNNDVRGNDLADLPAFKGVKTLKQIRLLAEFTGSVGVFDYYVQFFQNRETRPIFGHGCTSITIPEAYIYLDSGQLDGLLEGIAGAAWYSEMLQRESPARERDSSTVMNTGLGVAHVVVMLFILLGNLSGVVAGLRRIFS